MQNRKKQYIVFGLGRFGSSLAQTLCRMGHEVLAVDNDIERINEVSPFVTHAVQADATDEETMTSLGVRNFDAAVVSIGESVRDSILVSLLCKEKGVPYVVAKATDELHAKVLRKVGVDRVVFPERDMGERVAKSLASPGVLDLMNLTDDDLLADIVLPASWADKSIQTIDVRRKYHVSILAIHRGGSMLMNLSADTVLQSGDALVLLGHKDDIAAVEAIH